jgi:glycerophosphoryl diester phosphodiesterase
MRDYVFHARNEHRSTPVNATRPPRIVGHRGAAGHAPENTLASISRAAELGAEWVEFDCMLTGDGVPVLFHDDRLNRTTGRRGTVSKTPYATMASLDAGSWFGPDFAREVVPSLEAALRLLGEIGLGAMPEIKPCKGHDRETGAVVAATVVRHCPTHLPPPLLSSFSPIALQAAREEAPGVARARVCWQVPKDWADIAARLDLVAIHVCEADLMHRHVTAIKAAGLTVRAFTVNQGMRALELFRWGVDAVITDYPDRIAGALDAAAE